MKIYRLLLMGMFLLWGTNIFCQQNINSTVEVKKEFEGRLLEISKSALNTKYSDTLLKLDLNFDYSFFDRPYKDLYEFAPMQSFDVVERGQIKYPIFYSKLAMAYPFIPEADLYFSPKLGNNGYMSLNLNHYSFWGNVPRMTNKGGVSGGYSWSTGEVTAGVNYLNGYYAFSQEGLSRSFDMISANIGLHSSNPDPNSFYYDIDLKYDNTQDAKAVKENIFDASGLIGATFGGKHKFLLGFKSVTAGYDNSFTGTGYSEGYFELTPQYRFERKKWRILAGVSFAGVYGNNPKAIADSSLARIFPNVSVDFEAVPNSLWLFADVSAKNKFNTYSSFLLLNPWMSYEKDYVRSTAMPMTANLGIRGAVRDKFSYTLYGSYNFYNNYIAFIPTESTAQGVEYLKNVEELSVTAKMLFKTKDFSGGLNLKYSYFSGKVLPYMTPDITIDVFGRYNYKERIIAEVSCLYLSEMRGVRSVVVPGFLDLGLSLKYAMNSKLTLFLQGRNLLNKEIMYIQNYLQPGINIGLGMYVKL